MKIVRTVMATGLMALTPSAWAQSPAAAPAASNAAEAAALPSLAPVAGVGQPTPGAIGIQPQVTPDGAQALWMHDVMLVPVIVAISLFVLALLLYVVVRYRRSANPVPAKFSHNTLVEVLWTLGPVLILVVLFVPSYNLLAAQYAPAGKDAVTVKAIGNQWYWSYEYPDHGGFELVSNMLADAEAAKRGEPRLLAVDNRMVIPVNTQIRLLTTAADVIHSFALPAFWVKLDSVPGRINETQFTVTKEGVYYGQCSELCGARHGFMPIAVEVVSKERFAQWIASKGGTMPGAAEKAAAFSPVAAGDVRTQGPVPADDLAKAAGAGADTGVANTTDTPTPGTATGAAPANPATTNSGSN